MSSMHTVREYMYVCVVYIIWMITRLESYIFYAFTHMYVFIYQIIQQTFLVSPVPVLIQQRLNYLFSCTIHRAVLQVYC